MYKLLDYDITEYKLLENKLNELSKDGVNPVSLGRISKFNNNGKHYYYHVDLLDKKPTTPKRKAINDMINEYERNLFDYRGKIGKLMVFTSENKRNIPKNRQDSINAYLSTRKFNTISYLSICLFVMFIISSFIIKYDSLSNYLTNGSILFHYFPIFILFTIFIRCLFKVVVACKKQWNKHIKILFYIFSMITCLVLLLACTLDITERKEIKIDQSILTLQAFDKETNYNYPTYKALSSIVVDCNSYFEENNAGDVLYSKDYSFYKENNASKYFKQYINDYSDLKYQKIDDNTYLYKLDKYYDTLLYKYNNHFYYISTNFDLTNNYQKIIEFYK